MKKSITTLIGALVTLTIDNVIYLGALKCYPSVVDNSNQKSVIQPTPTIIIIDYDLNV